ncbi:unnamed protein product [Protopolystoma xenopodis]|uniref:Uncharacterized protein n=1 Tax=Protopolystoma xenopodis TaxID=117903 RepID=A0A3S5AUN5_9PLAT|nr:unnamed protein product [Protopolystoma xenopodis]
MQSSPPNSTNHQLEEDAFFLVETVNVLALARYPLGPEDPHSQEAGSKEEKAGGLPLASSDLKILVERATKLVYEVPRASTGWDEVTLETQPLALVLSKNSSIGRTFHLSITYTVIHALFTFERRTRNLILVVQMPLPVASQQSDLPNSLSLPRYLGYLLLEFSTPEAISYVLDTIYRQRGLMLNTFAYSAKASQEQDRFDTYLDFPRPQVSHGHHAIYQQTVILSTASVLNTISSREADGQLTCRLVEPQGHAKEPAYMIDVNRGPRISWSIIYPNGQNSSDSHVIFRSKVKYYGTVDAPEGAEDVRSTAIKLLFNRRYVLAETTLPSSSIVDHTSAIQPPRAPTSLGWYWLRCYHNNLDLQRGLILHSRGAPRSLSVEYSKVRRIHSLHDHDRFTLVSIQRQSQPMKLKYLVMKFRTKRDMDGFAEAIWHRRALLSDETSAEVAKTLVGREQNSVQSGIGSSRLNSLLHYHIQEEFGEDLHCSTIGGIKKTLKEEVKEDKRLKTKVRIFEEPSMAKAGLHEIPNEPLQFEKYRDTQTIPLVSALLPSLYEHK